MQKLERLDWNLVPTLNALLSERNVSRAARRLAISQPAASGALGRLRRFFEDELLVRKGHSYELTPLAERLLPLVSAAVASTRSLVESTSSFDPATSTRQFTVLMSDYAQIVLAPQLVAEVSRRGPQMQVVIEMTPSVGSQTDELQQAVGDPAHLLGEVDGWIAPLEAARGFPATGQVVDRWVCAVSTDNTTVGDTLTVDDLASARWVASTFPGLGRVPKLRQLLAHGVDPHIDVVSDTFAAVPFLVGGTHRLGLVQERLGQRLAEAAGVRLIECPVPLSSLHLTLWWHPDLERDPAHEWFRDVVAECFARA